MDYQVMAFDETTVQDFHDVILENVLAELYSLDNFEDYGVLAVGAMQNGQAIGAVIAKLLSEADVQIISLYVAPEFRGAGVATTMLDGVAALCFDLFDSIERYEVPVAICIDYVQDGEQTEKLEKFLEKNNFRFREERPEVYMLTAGCADALSGSDAARELPSYAGELFSAWADEAELNTKPELCVYTGEEDEPQCMMLLLDAGDGSFDLVSFAESGCSEADFEAALKLVLQKVDKNAEIFADGAKNVCPAVLAKAAGFGGNGFRHCYAQRRMIIEKEVAKGEEQA